MKNRNRSLESEETTDSVIDGMLLPPLCTIMDYVQFANGAGLKVFAEPMDISQQVKATW